MLLVGGETENVSLYYHMYDNFQIQFGKGEFYLVTGLKFGVEYSDDYDENDKPIPFRRQVFPSWLDGKRITGAKIYLKMKKYMEELNVDTRANREQIIADHHYGISGLSGFQRIHGGPSSFQTPTNNSIFNMGMPTNWQTSIPSQPGSFNWQSQMPAYTSTPNWQPPIPSHPSDTVLCDPYTLGCMTGADMNKCVYLKTVRDELLRSSCPKIELSPNPQHHRCSTTFAAVHLYYRCTTTLASPPFTFTVVAPPLLSLLTFTVVASPVLPLFTFTFVGPPPSPPFHHHIAGCGFTVDVIQSMLIIYTICWIVVDIIKLMKK
nr:hypothetical protein [Tanacetum cinerariifolium]